MTRKVFFSLVLMATAVGTVAAQKIAVTKGQKLETIATTKMNMEVMGQNMDNESMSTSNLEIKEVNADGYLFASTIKRMTVKGNGMGQEVSFDSDKKEDMDGQVGQALKGRIGTMQEIQVDKQGKVAAIKDSTDKNAGAGGLADIMTMTGDLTKGQPYPFLIQLPAKTVKPGDSWTDSSGTVATIKTVTIYTLKNIDAAGARVSFTGTMAKTSTIEQNGMEIQLEMSGVTKGEATYEAGSGLLQATSSATDIKGTLGIMGQNAPITATLTANIVAKKL